MPSSPGSTAAEPVRVPQSHSAYRDARDRRTGVRDRSAIARASRRIAGGTLAAMHIVSALFVENFEMRQAPGPSTRIDLTGVMFSMAAPEPAPLTITPHLVALIFCPAGEPGQGVFEVVFRRDLEPEGEGEPVARNVSPFSVEPGKFTYRLVRGELEFPDYGQCSPTAGSTVARGTSCRSRCCRRLTDTRPQRVVAIARPEPGKVDR